ncbi:MAG: nodulation protein NfeD [bacterium]
MSALAITAGALALVVGAPAQGTKTAWSVELQSSINPATAQWITSALGDAAEEDVELVIIRLDTPGGLDESMREMIREIIAAPMPVVVYVSPDGARAASAGLFITEAADVATMAPQTNIGSASPVSVTGDDVGEVLGRKIENDAAAYARALAKAHGRNAELAELMVTEAENVTATEALDAGLVDLIATGEDDLLAQLDGFEVQGPKAQTLDTEGIAIEARDMPLQYDLLDVIVNPTVAYLLLLVGLVGIAIEIFSPGLIVPGALGTVCFLLGAYGSSQLPVTLAGVALLVVGVAMIIAEAHIAAGGVLGAAGVVAVAVSGLLLYDTESEAFGISAPVAIAAGLFAGGLLAFAAKKVIEARRNPVRTGWEELIGAAGEVRQGLGPVGQVFVEGALWRAEPVDGIEQLPAGARVRVESVDGLTLRVRPVEQEGAS